MRPGRVLTPSGPLTRWMPLVEAVEVRDRQIRDIALAVLDLEQAQARARVRGMRRNLTSGDRERVSPSFWKDYRIVPFPRCVIIYNRVNVDKLDDYGNIAADRLDGWMFYVWRPDFDMLYSVGSSQVAPRSNSETPDDGWQVKRVKQLLLVVYPDGVPDGEYKKIQARLKPEFDQAMEGLHLTALRALSRLAARKPHAFLRAAGGHPLTLAHIRTPDVEGQREFRPSQQAARLARLRATAMLVSRNFASGTASPFSFSTVCRDAGDVVLARVCSSQESAAMALPRACIAPVTRVGKETGK
jgi:hypothetical protein